jgi:hypothetical protein
MGLGALRLCEKRPKIEVFQLRYGDTLAFSTVFSTVVEILGEKPNGTGTRAHRSDDRTRDCNTEPDAGGAPRRSLTLSARHD